MYDKSLGNTGAHEKRSGLMAQRLHFIAKHVDLSLCGVGLVFSAQTRVSNIFAHAVNHRDSAQLNAYVHSNLSRYCLFFFFFFSFIKIL